MYRTRRALERRWAVLFAIGVAGGAFAHDADVVYALVSELPGGQLEEVVTVTAGTLSALAPIDADGDGALSQQDLDARADAIRAGVWDQLVLAAAAAPCARTAEQARLREGYVELTARFRCGPGALTQDFRILRVLPSNYRVVLGRQLEGEVGRAFAQGNVQKLEVPRAPAALSTPGPPAPSLGLAEAPFAAGAALAWLLLLAFAATPRAALERGGALVLGWAAAAVALALGLRAPLAGQALAAAVGIATALAMLRRGGDAWPLATALVLGAGAGLQGSTLLLAGLGVLGLVGALATRTLRRRPRFYRGLAIGLACATLASLGFSLVQTIARF